MSLVAWRTRRGAIKTCLLLGQKTYILLEQKTYGYIYCWTRRHIYCWNRRYILLGQKTYILLEQKTYISCWGAIKTCLFIVGTDDRQVLLHGACRKHVHADRRDVYLVGTEDMSLAGRYMSLNCCNMRKTCLLMDRLLPPPPAPIDTRMFHQANMHIKHTCTCKLTHRRHQP